MNEVQRHRGPDDAGIYIDGRVGLGNRRLAIMDREYGHQPMSNEDGSVWITYNGEIFNYRELRSRLKSHGHRFKTNSDTEVILLAYEVFGEGCVKEFNGQFAFAIWDHPRKKLFLARDRMGIVPLHYTITDSQFIFASEAKAILEYLALDTPGTSRPDVNLEAVVEALLCGALLGDHTLFKGIQTLPPGHTLTLTAGPERSSRTDFSNLGFRLNKYWEIPLDIDTRLYGSTLGDLERYYAQNFLELLKDAVQLRLMGEVPLGILLSGGTDSSAIAKLATEKLTTKTQRHRESKINDSLCASAPLQLITPDLPVQTFTIDFPNPWKGEDHDATYARL
ncbi:MAG: asparagine synthase (glutamine-hydrolyzing), partial [Nitrospira sp.]|nr:asparagine synthase (glutamine-hydrolyzing) [Nitrospira sp.]